MHYDLSKLIDLKKLDIDELVRRANDKDNPDPSALFLGAIIVRDGYNITPVDMELSFDWARRGTDLGHPLCTALYSAFRSQGVGGKKTPIHITKADIDKILQPLEAQAKADEPYALSLLSVLYHYGLARPSSPDKTLKDMRQAAELGELDAAANLGTFYELGRQGLPVDRQQAIHWFTLAANQGNASAQDRLGTLYMNTPGTETEGLAWLEKAAEQNRVLSQSLLGHWHLGITSGSKFNYDLAVKWLTRAAGNSHTESTLSLAQLYEGRPGVKANPALAYTYYGLALSYETERRYFTRKLTKAEEREVKKRYDRLRAQATASKDPDTGETILGWPNCDNVVRVKAAPAPERPSKAPRKGKRRGRGGPGNGEQG
jgi:TPR repeat protein